MITGKYYNKFMITKKYYSNFILNNIIINFYIYVSILIYKKVEFLNFAILENNNCNFVKKQLGLEKNCFNIDLFDIHELIESNKFKGIFVTLNDDFCLYEYNVPYKLININYDIKIYFN